MDTIRMLIIICIAGFVAIGLVLLTPLWPLGVVLFVGIVLAGIYLNPKIDAKWEQAKKRFVKDNKKFEVVEMSDDSNIPSVEFPDEAEIRAYEIETGASVGKEVKRRSSTKKARHQEYGKAVEQFMKAFSIDKQRASILYSGGYTSLHDFEKATVGDIASLDGISPTMARKIVSKMNA